LIIFLGILGGDLLGGAAAIEERGQKIFSGFEPEKPTGDGVFNYTIVNPVFGLIGDYEIIAQFYFVNTDKTPSGLS